MAVSINETLVASLLRQPRFLELLPEFSGLRVQPREKVKKKACCGKATAETPVVRVSAFTFVLLSLSSGSVQRLKDYLGTDYIQFYKDNQLVQL
jgi:hypothetical protein